MEKKIYRLRSDRKISGVCSGLAIYLGIDVTIVRLLWVLVSLFTVGSVGLLVYIACVLIIPEEPQYYEAQYREK